MVLLVYKASAGSGKTFTLAVEYIKHLILNPRAYKQILAVTFTNKATAEMKERILQQLYGIWKGQSASEAYFKRIQLDLKDYKPYDPDTPYTLHFTDNDIRCQAGMALSYILHDYSNFRVVTIDSFFQSVMRGLARELDLNPNLQVELNQTDILNEAVNSLIAKLIPSSPVLAWLLDYIEERIQSDKRWSVSEEIKRFGNNIFNEEYVERGELLRQQLQDINVAKQYRKELRMLERTALNKMQAYHTLFIQKLEACGLSENDLNNRAKGISSYFCKLRDGKLSDKEVMNITLAKHLDSAENWASKSSRRRTEIINIAENSLRPLLQEAEATRQKCHAQITNCRLSLHHLNELQLLNHIDEEVRIQNHEHNRFLLSDTNALLHRLMQEGDSSFIYEKIGSSIRNVMIDEFQDTSRMQWDNFQLLLLEGLSQGADSLIVGDVKQSIYRWRNGDWRILNALSTSKQPQLLARFPLKLETLKTNRRSEANIIQFNNELFTQIVSYINNKYIDDFGEDCEPLLRAYADVEQLSPKTDIKGFAKVQLINSDEGNDYVKQTLHSMASEVQVLLQQGVKPSDIAILVRKNKNIPAIADFFEQEIGIQVISDEAFRLDASQAVCLLIDALRYLSDKRRVISLHSLKMHNLQHVLPYELIQHYDELHLMPLYELVEELYRILDISHISGQDAYLFTFFDSINEYLQANPSNINSFLKYWDEQLCSTTIPGSQAEGIRILSIHKSKGLEYHTVLIPFCDWKMENERNDQLVWCVPTQSPYDRLPLIPISYSTAMADSIYREDYINERLQLWVDNLNLLYVACTRAGKNLIIWSKKDKRGSMSELLSAALPIMADAGCGQWEESTSTFCLGKPCPSPAKRHSEKTCAEDNRFTIHPETVTLTMHSAMYDISFRQSNRSADFIAGTENNEDSTQHFINRGRMMHTLFADIATLNDIDAAIERLVSDGVIGSAEEEKEIRRLTTQAFRLPQVADWYSGKWNLLNERGILWIEEGDLCNRRPDRVMWKEKEIVVVDFKFGKPNPSHDKQVKGYIHLLERMEDTNCTHISGYLWYVEDNRINLIEKRVRI